MDPVDHVVANIHWIGIRRQDPHLESILESGRFERCAPPRRAFYERAAYRLGDAVVDVVHQRFDRFRHRCIRILLLEAMPRDPALLDRAGERTRVVVELDSEERNARIELARFEAGRRQLDERVMLANRHELRDRGHATDERAGTIVRLERQHRFDFGVLRKGFRSRQINRAATAIDGVVALLRRAQASRDAMHVAREEVGGVDCDGIGFALLDFEAPQHRSRERVFNGVALIRIVAQRAKVRVRFDEQQLRADALEVDEMRLAHLAPIESDRIRSDAGRQ